MAKEKDVFSEDDYNNVKIFNKKTNSGNTLEITPEERESFRKYTRMKQKGENPFSAYKEDILSSGITEEEMELYRSYHRKRNSGNISLVTPEERAARSKYQILKNRGII